MLKFFCPISSVKSFNQRWSILILMCVFMRSFNFRTREFDIMLPDVPNASCLVNSISSFKNCDIWTSRVCSRLKWGANQNHVQFIFLNVMCPVVWKSWIFSRKKTIFLSVAYRKTETGQWLRLFIMAGVNRLRNYAPSDHTNIRPGSCTTAAILCSNLSRE